jgi:hypothetical protein
MRLKRAVAPPFSVRVGGPHPLEFGTGRRWLGTIARKIPEGLRDNGRLFATAYVAGFIGVSLYIA